MYWGIDWRGYFYYKQPVFSNYNRYWNIFRQKDREFHEFSEYCITFGKACCYENEIPETPRPIDFFQADRLFRYIQCFVSRQNHIEKIFFKPIVYFIFMYIYRWNKWRAIMSVCIYSVFFQVSCNTVCNFWKKEKSWLPCVLLFSFVEHSCLCA